MEIEVNFILSTAPNDLSGLIPSPKTPRRFANWNFTVVGLYKNVKISMLSTATFGQGRWLEPACGSTVEIKILEYSIIFVLVVI